MPVERVRKPVSHHERLDARLRSDVPLYAAIRDRLADAVAEGRWPPGSALPSETALSETFGVSIGTLRKAVDDLVARQILLRQQGKGTFVALHTPRRLMFNFFHIVGRDDSRAYPAVTTLGFSTGRCSREEATQLQISPADRVFRIRNLLSLDGDPVIVDDITLPAHLFPGLTERGFTQRENTIYHFYQSRFGLNVVRTHERVKAVLAPPDIATLLGVDTDAPLLEIRRLALTWRDNPVEWRVSRVNSAAHEYENSFGKHEAWNPD
jgi:GntR family transcriptional regulator